MFVSQLINANGNPNANQFVIHEDSCIAFQSYDSRVCEISTDKNLNKVVKFGRDYNYSNTTSKHLNEFLRQNDLSCLASAKDRKEAIKLGYARYNKSVIVVYDDLMD